ncbi:MAG: hypothetical protein ACRC20_09920 [Segniliparus sp.]|uniref:hypothetical protein n=1 Tax=Segniliparus sp. TaxID=2804064 RepID=UPI003F35ABC0
MSYPPPYGPPPMQPYGYSPPPPSKPKPGAAPIVLVVVFVLVVIGSVFGGFLWHLRGARNPAGHTSVALRPTVHTGPLTARSDEELFAALPKREDFDKGWTVKTSKDSAPSASESALPGVRRGYFPPQCGAVFHADDVDMIGSVEALLNDEKNMFGQSISVELHRWRAGERLSRFDEYIAQCATYVEVDAFSTGEVDTTRLSVTTIDPPNVASSVPLKAYRKEGTTNAVYSDGRPPETSPFAADDSYATDVRGVLVWMYCGNSDLISKRCRAVFADVLTKLNRL